jgi:transcriptional regulator with XRE-family HTH domain
MTTGEAMRNAREKANYSKKELSQLSGINAYNIGQYELDRVKPRIDTAEMLADALGISIDEYIGHEVRK